MPSKSRPDPVIPDHEVLRKIGGGAYGEVWLGRGVTGALRALKVVWREDFEDARGFEREFEGILKFEPISRTHPGLVNILHVGRSVDGVSFYYYVMELGDDVRSGQDINPIEYEPRTLQADTKQSVSCQLPTALCIDVGVRLAEALDHLHERGLAHRDVKPSNVIFVHGKAKLADIGLVAARGQRTFVGTEGFVPPEGPGSTQADVYSLGKVLYEIATGKDRLDFPELPDTLPTGPDRKRWLELNRVICDICEPRLSKRKISTASALAEALGRLQRGKRRHKTHSVVWISSFVLLGFAGWAGFISTKGNEWLTAWTAEDPLPPKPKMGKIQILSTPEGADVFDMGGSYLGATPTAAIEGRVGEKMDFILRKSGYSPISFSETIKAGETMMVIKRLKVYSPPHPGDPWEDHLGNLYQPVEDFHVSSRYVNESVWKRFASEKKIPVKKEDFMEFSENGKRSSIVLASKERAAAFCEWLEETGKEGYLTKDHEAVPQIEESFQDPKMPQSAQKSGLRPFHIVVRKIKYGAITLTSIPSGAEVRLGNENVGETGETPLEIPHVKPGPVQLVLSLDGYEQLMISDNILPGQTKSFSPKLVKNQGVVFGKEWENGIEMRFVPLGPDLMVSIWETQVKDFALYSRDKGVAAPRVPEFSQGPESPVVNVSADDARKFCEWLTARERNRKRILDTHVYRLPTDLEWSRIAGLEEPPQLSPRDREKLKALIFPWGNEWPPPENIGNFADDSAALAPGIARDQTIPGYKDGYPFTAPVGSFPPNALGVFDISGNVQEWVDDRFLSGGVEFGVLRGGGWNTYSEERLYTGTRNFQDPSYGDRMYGFRVVLSRTPQVLPNPLDIAPETLQPDPPPTDDD